MEVVEAEEFLKAAEKKIDFNFQPKVALPDDDLTREVTGLSQSIMIGPGLVQHEDRVLANSVGVLSYHAPRSYWLETHKKRYFPKAGRSLLCCCKYY